MNRKRKFDDLLDTCGEFGSSVCLQPVLLLFVPATFVLKGLGLKFRSGCGDSACRASAYSPEDLPLPFGR